MMKLPLEELKKKSQALLDERRRIKMIIELMEAEKNQEKTQG